MRNIHVVFINKKRSALEHYILLFLLFAILLPIQSHSQNLQNVRDFLIASKDTLGFNGVVLITKSDSVLLHNGYGHSDQRKRIPTDKNTLYNIASVTKAFTAIAISKLSDQGKLLLSDPLYKFFTDVPQTKRNITIHQLLTHMSGFPQTYAAEGHSNSKDAVKELWKLALDSITGTYSNGNYALLGVIIEKVSGKDYEDYITETILRPLNMNNTFFWRDKHPKNQPAAEPISKVKKRQRDYGYLASTGTFSTASDLHKLQGALRTNIILSDSVKTKLLGKYGKIRSTIPKATDYFSYGMFQTEGEINSVWFRGNEEQWGVSIAYWFPQSNISVIVLSNRQELSNGQRPHNFISAGIIKIMDEHLRR
jgi:CubicO group peptidase (beta-lactamase class C family)